MRSRIVKQRLQALKEIHISDKRKEEQRELLLSQIQGQLPQEYTTSQQLKKNAIFSWQVFRFLIPTFVFRPVGTIVIALLLVVGSSVASASAAKSLPGDILYPVKIATERAQLTFTRSKETKAHLQIEFAQRRIEELQKIAADPKRQEQQIEKTMTRAKKSFEDAQMALRVLGENDIGKEEMMLIAKIIEEKSDELNKTVESIKKDIDKGPRVTELLEQIEETNVAALNTLATSQESDSDDERLSDDIAVLVQERISTLNQKIEKLDAFIKEYETVIKEKDKNADQTADDEVNNEADEQVISEQELIMQENEQEDEQEIEQGQQTQVDVVSEEISNTDKATDESQETEEFTPSGIDEGTITQETNTLELLKLSVEEVKALLKEAMQRLGEGDSEEALSLLAKGSQLILEAQRQAENL